MTLTAPGNLRKVYNAIRKINTKGDDNLSQFINGSDALNSLESQPKNIAPRNEFTPFTSGTSLKVKVVNLAAVQLVYAYSIYKKVHTFIAKDPSVRNAKGYVESNPTCWDKAADFHYKQSKAQRDAHATEGAKYLGKPKFAFALYDLTKGKFVVVELTKKQAQAVAAVFKKQESKLDRLAFEISKQGSGTDTAVTATPIVFMEDDLTEKEQENFKNSPKEVPADIFNGIWFEKSEEKMLEDLRLVGFDVTKIGYSATPDSAEENVQSSDEPADEMPQEDDLPF